MINVEKKKEKKKMSCHAICSVMLTMTCGSCGAIIDGGEVGQLSNYNDNKRLRSRVIVYSD